MVSIVDGSNVTWYAPAKAEQRLDPLAEKRAEESRQLAAAAARSDHHYKVQAAVQSFIDFQNAGATTSLDNAQKAYSEF